MADDNKDSIGVPPGGSVMFLMGLLAGYVVAKRGVVGVLLGTVTGAYVAQTYQVPNIESTVKDYLDKLKKVPKTYQVPNIESTVKDYLDKLKKGPK